MKIEKFHLRHTLLNQNNAHAQFLNINLSEPDIMRGWFLGPKTGSGGAVAAFTDWEILKLGISHEWEKVPVG